MAWVFLALMVIRIMVSLWATIPNFLPLLVGVLLVFVAFRVLVWYQLRPSKSKRPRSPR